MGSLLLPVTNMKDTDVQIAMNRDLKECIALHAYPPTVQEIMEVCGLNSTSIVLSTILRLERTEYLARKPGLAWGIALAEQGCSWVWISPDIAAREAA